VAHRLLACLVTKITARTAAAALDRAVRAPWTSRRLKATPDEDGAEAAVLVAARSPRGNSSCK
jgi:hypothetical protein